MHEQKQILFLNFLSKLIIRPIYFNMSLQGYRKHSHALKEVSNV